MMRRTKKEKLQQRNHLGTVSKTTAVGGGEGGGWGRGWG